MIAVFTFGLLLLLICDDENNFKRLFTFTISNLHIWFDSWNLKCSLVSASK